MICFVLQGISACFGSAVAHCNKQMWRRNTLHRVTFIKMAPRCPPVQPSYTSPKVRPSSTLGQDGPVTAVCVCVCLHLWDKMVVLLLCVFVTLRQVGPSPSPRWSWNTFSSGIHTLLEINKQTIDHIIDQDNALWVNLINHCTNLGTSGQVMVTLTKSHIVDQYQCQLPCWPTQMHKFGQPCHPCQHLVQVLVAPKPG